MNLSERTQNKLGKIVRIKCLKSKSSHFKAKEVYQGRLSKIDKYTMLVSIRRPLKRNGITVNVEMMKDKKQKYGVFSFAPTNEELK